MSLLKAATLAGASVLCAYALGEELLIGDFDAVRADIRKLLPDENFDVGNHGPNFIRLAWHCTGSYRTSDGRGGCDGGRIRFEPEFSWGSNMNLDKTLDYLTPIKLKYGSKLSWGDLIVLAGNTAIEEGNGPTIPFCGGRVDAIDGTESMPLNNTEIYINPETGDAQGVRDSFDKMDMNDTETVALIAGGHAYGGGHPETSGFQGYWTKDPVMFSNEYVKNLYDLEWRETVSPTGRKQFENEAEGLFMLPTDLAMLDDADYDKILRKYYDDEDLLKKDFGNAWTKLTTRDQGPRPCLGDYVAPIESDIDFGKVRDAIKAILPDENADFGHYGGLFVRLAWHCAGTYRSTDHRGGCNGARIRHDPEINWGSNAHLDFALALLEPIKKRFGPGLSWADLIILTGNTAFEDLGSKPLPFCPGRIDEDSGEGSKYLDDAIYLDAAIADADDLKESMKIMGFNNQEMTVLNGGGHSIGRMHRDRSGFHGPWTRNPTQFGNEYFKLLLSEEWIPRNDSVTDKPHYTDKATEELTMLNTDISFLRDPEFRKFVEDYAADEDLFQDDFAKAWTKLTNADRFGGICDNYLTPEHLCLSEATSKCDPSASCAGYTKLECNTHQLRCRYRQNRCEDRPCKRIRDEATCLLASPRCEPLYSRAGYRKCMRA